MSTSGYPTFSIVLATYNRSHHIKPTVESILQQDLPDFELLVIGDACTDDTEQAVMSFGDRRVSWNNLPTNGGSQSFPNNEGICHARGRLIGYIGHDDIWMPDHLTNLHKAFESEPTADIAVSGCIYHGPPDSDFYTVTGLFETSDTPPNQFFPPSSFCHRRDVTDRIGPWRGPLEMAAPVDADFLLRATDAGLRFVSTGKITVQKFAAGHRYLSYLHQTSDEQMAMLNHIRTNGDAHVQAWIDAAKRDDRYMTMHMTHLNFSNSENGANFRHNRKNKGLDRPPLKPLDRFTRIQQSDEPRALDWQPLEHGLRPFRWSGPNPHPKILIPYTGGHIDVVIQVLALPNGVRAEDVMIAVNDKPTRHVVEITPDGIVWLNFQAKLKSTDYTVITLHMPVMSTPDDTLSNGDRRRLGIAVGNVFLDPS